MRVLIVSGLWPPDVGGPASHAPEFAEALRGRGHEVEVVTTADASPAPEPYPVRWVDRRLPVGVRHARGVALVRGLARGADVVYSTGMLGRSGLGTLSARRPLVVKLTSDPTFERSLRYGLTPPDLMRFQELRGLRIRTLRTVRDQILRRASRIVTPSASLRELALTWGLAPERVVVVPNPVSAPAELPAREEVRRRHGLEGRVLGFAGRLVPQKSLDVALRALTRSEPATLLVAGDGPDAEALRRLSAELGLDGRVRFLGPQPRATTFELLRAADVALLSSSWENFPHMLVEALAIGTPVIATDVGGVGEIVEHERNGILVRPGDADALAAAIDRFFADGALRARLEQAAVDSVAEYAPDAIYDRLEAVLREVARG
jgi:glycosyltransferase involved in cell wall biosynthesis